MQERDILELLTREFPPDADRRWKKDGSSYSCTVAGHRLELAPASPVGWFFGWMNTFPHGHDIPAAIANFRKRIAAEAVAVGAVPKATPTPEYNEVEAAIFGAAFVAQLPKWEDCRDAARVAAPSVEYYRATLK